MASTRQPQISGEPLAQLWGRRLQERRQELTLSVNELAQLVQMTPQAIWLFERGDRIPLDRTKIALARALGTTPAELFEWPPMEDLVGDAA